MQGTVKIHIVDILNGNECFILMHDVLFVPEISRRLLSVRQWNITGGDVTFDINHCVLTVCNHTTEECFEFIVTPPYASTQEDLHDMQANYHDAFPTVARKPKSKRRVESSLLHKRMGHRSLPVLMNASEHDL